MRAWLSVFLFAAFGLALFSTAGCASSARIVQADPGTGMVANLSAVIAPPMRVWVLAPKLTFERTQNEAPLDAAAYRGFETCGMLTAFGITAMKSKGTQDVRSMTDNDFPADLKAQAELASASAQRMFLSKPDPQVVQAIQRLGEAKPQTAALVQYVRVKVGPGGWYNPAPPSDYYISASSTHLRAALVDCPTGGILWQNSVLLRDLPKPGSPDMIKALEQLYSTLHFKP